MLAFLALFACGRAEPGGNDRKAVPGRDLVIMDETRGPAELQREIDRLRATVDGPVGISVRDLDEGWKVENGAGRLLPQQSVSKLWVALALLDAVDRGTLSLDAPLMVTQSDLTLFHQPIASLVGPAGYATTPRRLLERALTQSDNTANDRLLTLVGGPQAVKRALAIRNITGVGFGSGERALQSKTAGMTWRQDYARGGFERARSSLPAYARSQAYRRYVDNPPDGASANGITTALGKIRAGQALSSASTDLLLSIMSRTRTGRARLRAGLTAGWRIAHKTGTGQTYAGRTAGFNDVGFLVSPDGHVYAVAVMIGDDGSGERVRQRLIAGVARAVVAAHVARHPYTAWSTSAS